MDVGGRKGISDRARVELKTKREQDEDGGFDGKLDIALRDVVDEADVNLEGHRHFGGGDILGLHGSAHEHRDAGAVVREGLAWVATSATPERTLGAFNVGAVPQSGIATGDDGWGLSWAWAGLSFHAGVD